MRRSLLYFVAAALCGVAAALSLYNDGATLRLLLGSVFGAAMLALGLQARKVGN